MSEQLLAFRLGPGEAGLPVLIHFASIKSILELEMVNEVCLMAVHR